MRCHKVLSSGKQCHRQICVAGGKTHEKSKYCWQHENSSTKKHKHTHNNKKYMQKGGDPQRIEGIVRVYSTLDDGDKSQVKNQICAANQYQLGPLAPPLISENPYGKISLSPRPSDRSSYGTIPGQNPRDSIFTYGQTPEGPSSDTKPGFFGRIMNTINPQRSESQTFPGPQRAGPTYGVLPSPRKPEEQGFFSSFFGPKSQQAQSQQLTGPQNANILRPGTNIPGQLPPPPIIPIPIPVPIRPKPGDLEGELENNHKNHIDMQNFLIEEQNDNIEIAKAIDDTTKFLTACRTNNDQMNKLRNANSKLMNDKQKFIQESANFRGELTRFNQNAKFPNEQEYNRAKANLQNKARILTAKKDQITAEHNKIKQGLEQAKANKQQTCSTVVLEPAPTINPAFARPPQ